MVEIVAQVGALDVGEIRCRIVGIVELRHEPLRGRRRRRDLAAQLVGADDEFLVGLFLAVDGLDDAVLDVAGEALVEPHVAPGGIGDEIARPRMGQLVRDQRHQALVADQYGRCREGQARVLHAAEREARWQHEDVVATPAIGTVQLLGGLDHLLGVGKLLGCLLDDRRFGIHRTARAGFAYGEITDRDREQVGRDRLVHREPVVAIERVPRIIVGAHHCTQRLGNDHVRAVGEAHRRRVLQWHPAARMDRLRLRIHERLFLACRLCRRHPLQARGLRQRVVVDAHRRRRAVERDAQRRATHRIGRVELELDRMRRPADAPGLDPVDDEIARVEHEFMCGAVVPVELQFGRAGQLPGGEIDRQVERERLHAHLVGLGVGKGVGFGMRERHGEHTQRSERRGAQQQRHDGGLHNDMIA